MEITNDTFFFPHSAIPHTAFTAKHAFIMATVNKHIKGGATSLNIIEIGSWIGASTLLWCESIRHFGGEQIARNSTILSVDSWNPILCSEDLKIGTYQIFVDAAKDDCAYRIFCHNAAVGTKKFAVDIKHIRGPSEDILPGLAPESFDIACVDASHYYDDVTIDIAMAKELVKIGGTICGDDLNLPLDQVDPEVTRVNRNRDFIRDAASGTNYHPGVTLAVGEAFPAVGFCGGFWSVRRTSADTFTPNDVWFDGIFAPSFLSEAEQRAFLDEIGPHYP